LIVNGYVHYLREHTLFGQGTLAATKDRLMAWALPPLAWLACRQRVWTIFVVDTALIAGDDA